MNIDTIQTIDGIQELLYLGFHRILPSPTLTPWIECFWSAKSVLSRQYQEKLYPDGGSSLQFHFSGTTKGIWFNSLQTLNQISFDGEVDSFGIRFRPGGAYALLGVPINELTSEVVAVQDLKLNGIERLVQQLAVSGFQRRIHLVEVWLLQKVQTHRAVSGPVQYLSNQLSATDVDITETLNDMGLARRRVERFFQQQVGIAPNQLKMLLRIKKARHQLKLNPDQLLVDTALQCGYFDQAHFNHHFRNVTGYTPGEYKLKQRKRLSNQEMIIEPRLWNRLLKT